MKLKRNVLRSLKSLIVLRSLDLILIVFLDIQSTNTWLLFYLNPRLVLWALNAVFPSRRLEMKNDCGMSKQIPPDGIIKIVSSQLAITLSHFPRSCSLVHVFNFSPLFNFRVLKGLSRPPSDFPPCERICGIFYMPCTVIYRFSLRMIHAGEMQCKTEKSFSKVKSL